ncbi:hypothetical protein [Vulcanisaeta sp. JCM 16159]|uniref:hypothetical protein n=1 Tax=Vulcanisaeta sp. JCM 16159 TaxID=1295371 RepID=UPI000A92F4E5|nr:hypothetical protein [Vulcanisaeta sp. JCM 16159]
MFRNKQVRQSVSCLVTDLIDDALRIIAYGRAGLMSKDEVLDILWELLVNVEYELSRGSMRVEELRN